ncbi:MAG TPA: hypothetical protein VFK09_08780, partial [Gemmatimonadales bacterium]|nr:hypothetical protein [Gemmatimonadales bacterium]
VLSLALVARNHRAPAPPAVESAVTADSSARPAPDGPALPPAPAVAAATLAREDSAASAPPPAFAKPASRAKPAPAAAAPVAVDSVPAPVDSAPVAPPAVESAAPPPTPASLPTREVTGASALLGLGGGAAAAPAPAAGDRRSVERAIQAYASALDRGDAAAARRAFPRLPEAEHARLGGLFASGGRVETRWKISNVALHGDSAAARVRGRTLTATAGGAPAEEQVDATVTLQRTGGVWHLTRFGPLGGP